MGSSNTRCSTGGDSRLYTKIRVALLNQEVGALPRISWVMAQPLRPISKEVLLLELVRISRENISTKAMPNTKTTKVSCVEPASQKRFKNTTILTKTCKVAWQQQTNQITQNQVDKTQFIIRTQAATILLNSMSVTSILNKQKVEYFKLITLNK